VTDLDNIERVVILEASQLLGAPNTILKPLLEKGLQVAHDATAKKHLVKLLQEWKPKKRFERTGVLGWADENFDTFVFGDGSSLGKKSVVLDQHLHSAGKLMCARGSFAAWRANVAQPCIGDRTDAERFFRFV